MKATWVQWLLGGVFTVLIGASALLWSEVEASLELGQCNQIAISVLAERTVGIKESLGRIESVLISVSRKLDDHMLSEIKGRVNKE